MTTSEPNAKVLFRVLNDDGSSDVETLWATHLGDDRYKLDNSPFYAYGVSWQDVVLAPFNSDDVGARRPDVYELVSTRRITSS